MALYNNNDVVLKTFSSQDLSIPQIKNNTAGLKGIFVNIFHKLFLKNKVYRNTLRGIARAP